MKAKRYDEGGILTDRYGNPVKSGSGETVKTRYGSSSEDRPKSSGVDDYESMGKRAGATSPFAGPKEYIKESIEEESPKSSSEPDSVAGKGAKNLAFEPDVEVKKKTVIKKKVTPKYEDTKAKIGNQSFMPSDAERRRQLEAADKPLEGVHPESYFMPGPLGALSKLATAKRISKIAPELNTIRAPMQKALEYTGSKAKQLTNEPLKLGMRKGGAVKKMSSGGKTSTASSRGDGIAQRGKTRGRMC
jgi:hypothetical protein